MSRLIFFLIHISMLSTALYIGTAKSSMYFGFNSGYVLYENGSKEGIDSYKEGNSWGGIIGYNFDHYSSLEYNFSKFELNENTGRTWVHELTPKLRFPLLEQFDLSIGYGASYTKNFGGVFKFGISEKISDIFTGELKYNYYHDMGLLKEQKDNIHMLSLSLLVDSPDYKTNNVLENLGHTISNENNPKSSINCLISNERNCSVPEKETLSLAIFKNNSSYFDHDSYGIKKLEKILLNKNIVKISIIGYASSSGSDDYNYWISYRRAKRVHEYILNLGLFDGDVELMGKGSSNSDDVEMASDRRVVVEIYSDKKTDNK